MDMLMAVCAGVGLAAACGFRVFVPLLVMGIAARVGGIEPSEGLEWVGSWPAIGMFAAATVAEIGAYYIPWVDNLLDTVASPGAVVAGTVAAAAAMPDVHPAVKWGAAFVAGGGPAGVVQLGTVVTRGISGATTGGVGNPVVSTAEWVLSLVLAIVAVLVPILAAIVVLWILVKAIKQIVRWRRGSRSAITTG